MFTCVKNKLSSSTPLSMKSLNKIGLDLNVEKKTENTLTKFLLPESQSAAQCASTP